MAFFSKPKTVWQGSLAAYQDRWAQMMVPLDYNRDGRLDLVVVRLIYPVEETAVRVQLLQQTSTGTFVDRASSDIDGATARTFHARELIRADFNGDGRQDVFIADHGYDAPPFPGAQNTLLLSSGRKLVNVSSTHLPQETEFTHSASAGDVDGDGDIDLLVGDDAPRVLFNDGTGNFSTAITLSVPLNEAYWAMEIGDLDGDGDRDIFLGRSEANASRILLNNGSGAFTDSGFTLPVDGIGVRNTIYDVKLVDLDGNGFRDMVLLYTGQSLSGRAVSIWMNYGGGTIVDETADRISYSYATGSFAPFIRFADFNRDGALDMMIAPNFSTKSDFLINNGDGEFFRPKNWRQEVGFQPELGDFNGDGKIDIASWGAQFILEMRTFDDGPIYSLNGNSGSNTLYGDARANRMDGAGGGDTIRSGAGNDKVTGGAGNDTIDGGSDIDTAFFSGSRADYAITVEADGYRIIDLRSSGGTGSDYVEDVEFFRFSDGLVAEADLII